MSKYTLASVLSRRFLGRQSWLLIGGLTLALSACSGGGDDEESQSVNGTFADSVVTGLTFETGGRTAQTDANGRFTCGAGDFITFRVGGVVLGNASCATSDNFFMTPKDLATCDSNCQTNVARFLLAFTAAGSTKTITITPAQSEAAKNLSGLDFRVTPAAFVAQTQSNPQVASFLGTLPRQALAPEAEATQHLTCSLQDITRGSTPDGDCTTTGTGGSGGAAGGSGGAAGGSGGAAGGSGGAAGGSGGAAGGSGGTAGGSGGAAGGSGGAAGGAGGAAGGSGGTAGGSGGTAGGSGGGTALVVSFDAAASAGSEAAPGNVNVVVKLSTASANATEVSFTVGGTASNPNDFTISASPVTIAANSTTANIVVAVKDDVVDDDNETVVLTLTAATNGATVDQAKKINTLTIADNDPVAQSQFKVSGLVSGLTGAGLVLQNNAADNKTLDAYGSTFEFSPQNNATPYAVTIQTQPVGQKCIVSRGAGNIAGGDVKNVLVTCAACAGDAAPVKPNMTVDFNADSNRWDLKDACGAVVQPRGVNYPFIERYNQGNFTAENLSAVTDSVAKTGANTV